MNDQTKIRVLIVDDHQVVRQGLRTFLELHDDLLVVGEAGDGAAAVELARSLEPDVILMDLVMPQMDGIGATREIKTAQPHIQIICLTSFVDDDRVVPVIQAGASGYLLKDVSPDELVAVVRAAQRGEIRLPPDIVQKLMAQVARSAAPRTADVNLTERELQVLALVAQGQSNAEIAAQLVISVKTVKTHISNLLSKLNLADRTQLAIYALKHGLDVL
ncbi:response regulator transcription factor [Anaerolineae bacterium CFX7]|nr:response regulator transcription factor [Anaerolineae bacterium CFX7]